MQAISTEHSSRANSTSLAPGEADLGSGTKEPRSRHRASVACAACRERRIRCVVPPGEDNCVQCGRSGLECIIKNDDERRRPISRAYMNSLISRISVLESVLKERGITVPSAAHPPQTTKCSSQSEEDQAHPQPFPDLQSYHDAPMPANDLGLPLSDMVGEAIAASQKDVKPSLTSRNLHPHQEQSQRGLVNDQDHNCLERLLSTRGHLSWDQLSGKLRYYGPTSHPQIYLELDQNNVKSSREAQEQARRAERLIRTLPPGTHDYLMHLFWQHYNSVLLVVHEEAFMSDRENGDTRFYSGFLHVCILTMGYRFADKSRPDVQRIALPDRESTIHREAKYMLDLELERPGGVPSVAALLILGDAEVGAGRDNVGWMYAGMAIRLAYDLGLHLDSRQSGMSDLEKDVRNMTLWACVIFDKYWSLFLGRPTSMKSADLEVYSLVQSFERLGSCRPAGLGGSINTRIYEALIELMEIGGKIVEFPEHRRQASNATHIPDHSSYLRMIAVDRELRLWASRLPEDLRYVKANLTSAPFALFMLHQQYHAVLILLHRPFARYDNVDMEMNGHTTNALDNHFSNASRVICTKSAVAIACIFWEHRKRFDGRVMFSGAMQHAGTAAMALTAALAYTQSAEERIMNMRYLDVLCAALQDMSHMLQPAEKMAIVLRAVMITLRAGRKSEPFRRMSTQTSVSALANPADQDSMHRVSYNPIHPSYSAVHQVPSGPDSRPGEVPERYYQLNSSSGNVPQGSDAGWPAFAPAYDMAPLDSLFMADTGSLPTSTSEYHYNWQNSHSTTGMATTGAEPDIQYSNMIDGAVSWCQPSDTDWAQW